VRPGDPAARVEQLAALGGFRGDLATSACAQARWGRFAATAASRAGNQNNPRPATVAEIEQMLRSIF